MQLLCAHIYVLEKQREQLHKGLGFGLDRPLFRRSQAYIFPGEGLVNGPLLNPHQGLNSGGMISTKLELFIDRKNLL